MPRRPRNQTVEPGMPHHIVTRGNNRRRLFSYRTDYRRFLYYLDDARVEHACSLQQISLMPNHVHLIMTPPEKDSLSDAMQRCLQRYSRYRNESREASGRLFEERFWCEPLLTLEAVEAITLYNDSNALQASMVDRPEDHRWSTCAIHRARSAGPQRSVWQPPRRARRLTWRPVLCCAGS